MKIVEAVWARIEARFAGLRRTGKVTAIVGTGRAAKVTVSVDGSSMTLPKLISYTPTVGDVVLIDSALPGSWVVLGATK